MRSASAPGSSKDLDIRAGNGFCLIRIRVTPKASRNEVMGVADGCLRLKINAPPVDGAANEKAREFLAEILGLPKRDLVLERGQTAREKVFKVMGLGEAEIRSRLASF
jgi:uncharacterized protein (TIGR00251 family)